MLPHNTPAKAGNLYWVLAADISKAPNGQGRRWVTVYGSNYGTTVNPPAFDPGDPKHQQHRSGSASMTPEFDETAPSSLPRA